MTTMRLKSSQSYSIAWIAILHTDRAAATAALDERHETPETFVQHSRDNNSYTWGRVGNHNIVIASLPLGMSGNAPAAVTAVSLMFSLPHISVGMLIGTGGGIAEPHQGRDIRLGDIVVSRPDVVAGGVIQYDLGKAKLDNVWERKGSLNNPPQVFLNALGMLCAQHEIDEPKFPGILHKMLTAQPQMTEPDSSYTHPGLDHDRLFNAGYKHIGGPTCDACDATQEIKRTGRASSDPKIHYGIVASGDITFSRDSILNYAKEQCLCIDNSSAGVMNYLPCIVIRGICDYADSHKNDRWQRYASATAAAFAVELLSYVPARRMQTTEEVDRILASEVGEQLKDIVVMTKNDMERARTHTSKSHQGAVGASLVYNQINSSDSRKTENEATYSRNQHIGLLEGIPTNYTSADPDPRS